MTNSEDALREADDPSELPLFCTIRIVATLKSGDHSVGTGFFYVFARCEDGSHIPTIVTNRHVIEGAESIELIFRKSAPDFARPLLGKGIPVKLSEFVSINHPDDPIDLCAIPI